MLFLQISLLVPNHAQIQSTPDLVVGLARNNSAWNRGYFVVSSALERYLLVAVLFRELAAINNYGLFLAAAFSPFPACIVTVHACMCVL